MPFTVNDIFHVPGGTALIRTRAADGRTPPRGLRTLQENQLSEGQDLRQDVVWVQQCAAVLEPLHMSAANVITC